MRRGPDPARTGTLGRGRRAGAGGVATDGVAGAGCHAATASPNSERTNAVTSTVRDPIELLRDALEEQFQRQTDRLAELTVLSQQPHRDGHGGHDGDTIAALVASARQVVADTARALRRMADGSYGICERCAASIALERLEILPHARFCVPCQRKQIG